MTESHIATAELARINPVGLAAPAAVLCLLASAAAIADDFRSTGVADQRTLIEAFRKRQKLAGFQNIFCSYRFPQGDTAGTAFAAMQRDLGYFAGAFNPLQ